MNITSARITHYMDSGQDIAYVGWDDGSTTSGDPDNDHIASLLHRALMNGLVIEDDRPIAAYCMNCGDTSPVNGNKRCPSCGH